MRIRCAHCKKSVERETGHVNRSRKIRAPLYCGRRCSGLGRRKWKPKAQKVAEKRLYDRAYRAKNLKRIKAEKRAYFKRTYDPVKAARERKKRMPRHVAYCRQPRYKAYKSAYDAKRRATNPRARLGLPQWTPGDLVKSIQLLRAFRQEQKREHKRA